MTEQGQPPGQPDYPGRPGRPRGGRREPRRTGWQALDAFDNSDTESDLPPWAVPGGVMPNRAARQATGRPPRHQGDERDWPGDRAFGVPRMARHAAAAPGQTEPRLPEPRTAEPGWRDPYDDSLTYDEPSGYRRSPGYDEPPEDGSGGGYDEYADDEQAAGYAEPDHYGDPARTGEPEELSPNPAPGRRSRPGAQDDEGDEGAGRRLRRPGRSRAAAARRRRSKRRLVTWGGVAALIVVLVAGGLYLTRSQPKKSPYVKTLQKGEFRSVPSACKVLGAATLHQIMAGTPTARPVGGGQGQSECTFTVDVKPAFRTLQITEQAYQPSLAVPSGNGSATANAAWNFGQAKLQLAKPPKHSVWPAATSSLISGLGDQAVSAVQASRGHVVTDRVTVLIRYRNVLIQVQAQAQEGGGFGPVPVADLRLAALTAARDTFAAVQHRPTA